MAGLLAPLRTSRVMGRRLRQHRGDRIEGTHFARCGMTPHRLATRRKARACTCGVTQIQEALDKSLGPAF